MWFMASKWRRQRPRVFSTFSPLLGDEPGCGRLLQSPFKQLLTMAADLQAKYQKLAQEYSKVGRIDFIF